MFRIMNFQLFLLCLLLHFSSAISPSPYARNVPSITQIRHSNPLLANFDTRLRRRVEPAGSGPAFNTVDSAYLSESPHIATGYPDRSAGAVPQARPGYVELIHLPHHPTGAAHAAAAPQAGVTSPMIPNPQEAETRARKICGAYRRDSRALQGCTTNERATITAACCGIAGICGGVAMTLVGEEKTRLAGVVLMGAGLGTTLCANAVRRAGPYY
jgi:hypothetical protein